ATANSATSATIGTPTPNSKTIDSLTPSRSPKTGRPGLSRRNQAIANIVTAPANTIVATASIHHHSSMMLWAWGLWVETIDWGLPQPPTSSPQAVAGTTATRLLTWRHGR